jgi:hypothetical protein
MNAPYMATTAVTPAVNSEIRCSFRRPGRGDAPLEIDAGIGVQTVEQEGNAESAG